MELNRTNMTEDMFAEQLSDLLSMDDASLEMALASGQIDGIVDSIFNKQTARKQLAEFRAAGLTRDEMAEEIDSFKEAIDDLISSLSVADGSSPTQMKVVERLLRPGVAFMREIYDDFVKGDAVLKVELMEGAKIPTRAHEADAGMDVYATGNTIIAPGEIVLIGTGLKVAIPVGWQLSVRPRSGLSLKGLTVANAPGTIDANYHDEIKVIVKNNTSEPFTVFEGDRIAQLVLEKVYTATWEQVEDITQVGLENRANESGEQGFGSTGV